MHNSFLEIIVLYQINVKEILSKVVSCLARSGEGGLMLLLFLRAPSTGVDAGGKLLPRRRLEDGVGEEVSSRPRTTCDDYQNSHFSLAWRRTIIWHRLQAAEYLPVGEQRSNDTLCTSLHAHSNIRNLQIYTPWVQHLKKLNKYSDI